MNKPRLTKRIVNGLSNIYPFLDVNLYDESDLFRSRTEAEQQEIMDAVSWIGTLLNWYREKSKST